MVKFKTLKGCILIICAVLFGEFFDISVMGQNPVSLPANGEPYVKCLELKNERISTFASDNNKTILFETTGNIRLLNNSDHLQNWNIELGSKLETVPYLSDNGITLLSYTNGNEILTRQSILREIDSDTGVTRWIFNAESPGRFFLISNEHTKNLTLLSDKLNIRQIDSKNGKLRWSKDLKGELKNHVSSGNSLFILTKDDTFFQIDLKDGSIQTERKIKLKNISALSLTADSIFFGNKKGFLYKYSEDSNTETKLFRTGGEVSTIKPLGNDLLIVSNDNFLYLYSTEKEKVLWKKRLAGRVGLEPIFFRNMIFVTTPVEPSIYILDRSDGSFVNRIDLGEGYIIKQIGINDNSIDVLTTAGLLKFSNKCREKIEPDQ